MARVAKKQSLKVISVGKTMNIISQIMRVMNQTVKKNSAKRKIYTMVKGQVLKIRIVGREVRKTHLVRKKVTIKV